MSDYVRGACTQFRKLWAAVQWVSLYSLHHVNVLDVCRRTLFPWGSMSINITYIGLFGSLGFWTNMKTSQHWSCSASCFARQMQSAALPNRTLPHTPLRVQVPNNWVLGPKGQFLPPEHVPSFEPWGCLYVPRPSDVVPVWVVDYIIPYPKTHNKPQKELHWSLWVMQSL